MLLTMKDPAFDLPVQVRTNARAKLAFDRVVANLRASDGIRWKGKRATKEAAFAAVWLWLEGLDPSIVEGAIAAQMGRLESIQAGESDPGPSTVPSPEPALPPVPERPTITVKDAAPPARKPRRQGGAG